MTKRVVTGFLILAIGMALGLAVPPLLAQSDAPPQVQKWEQYCQIVDGFTGRGAIKKENEKMMAAGAQGFQLVGSNGTVFCYRRPAP
ncbi:MAG: hypothetical protein AAF997_06200 [Myxococcota bacterium]